MTTYIILLRGINVGGKNKIAMSELKICLEKLGFSQVLTYIASGNVILGSHESPDKIKTKIEAALSTYFTLDSELIKVLVLTRDQLHAVVDKKPQSFGDHPQTYHSDAIFLIDIDTNQAMSIFSPREGVDKIWKGTGVIYSQRLSSERTKSRLNKIISTPLYRSMTIRSWNTTTKLLQIVDDRLSASEHKE